MLCGGIELPIDRFPTACREAMGEQKRCWRGLWRRWSELPAEPMRITATLASGYVAPIDGQIHLDGVLSAACLTVFASEAYASPYVIPLPLALAWVAPSGEPLWLATDLSPVGPGAPPIGVSYIHARYPTHRADLADRQSANTSAGRYKDTRLPLPTAMTDEVEGYCIGNLLEVTKLLDRVTHIGRKSAHGHGRVFRWAVDPAPGVTPAFILDRRPVPVEFLGAHSIKTDPSRINPRRGWTPPYWHAPLHGPVRVPQWT